jgi:flagellar hook assembly protein FlgD
VSLASPEVNWEPATEEKDFTVEYQPGTLEDGLYGLRVQATDASDNLSGVQPYEINFEVVNETTITHFYPYPNPFSTSTRFVFTLTGSVIPDELKIQIMTVTGRVVREITQDELGTINVGNNISDFAWDGTDEFGDQLANGVYLYRVIVRQNGQSIDRRSTAADNAFTKDFGKLYILR